MTSQSKVIYRSLSAKVTIFIQVCREIWEFAGDGERYTEKVVHSFLPALFRRWREADTNHTVTIVLISRVYYLDSEIDYAAGPLRQDVSYLTLVQPENCMKDIIRTRIYFREKDCHAQENAWVCESRVCLEHP